MSEVVVKAVSTEEELRLANGLMARARSAGHAEAVRWVERVGANHPNSRREHTRVALVGGEVAGALRITSETMRLGEARLKMGGLGWVATSERYQRLGVTRELVSNAMAYLEKQNYHLAVLFAAPNFYSDLGFSEALSDYLLLADTVPALDIAAELRVRSSKPGDIPAMQRLHTAQDMLVPCSVVRGSANFANRWDIWEAARVVNDAQGRVIGYFLPRVEQHSLVIEECAAQTSKAFDTVLQASAAIAMEAQCHRIAFRLPPSHRCAAFLQRHAQSIHLEQQSSAGGLVAPVQTAELLESLVPEWESLLVEHAIREQHVEVTLLIELKPYRITAHRGAIAVVAGTGKNKLGLTKTDFVQMLTGSIPASQVMERNLRLLTPDARVFLSLIFPKREPFIWPLDRF